METGVIQASRTLRAVGKRKGIDPDIQRRLDIACVTPHLHPRHLRNDTPKRKIRKPYTNDLVYHAWKIEQEITRGEAAIS